MESQGNGMEVLEIGDRPRDSGREARTKVKCPYSKEQRDGETHPGSYLSEHSKC